jgi:hypothetical protein
VANDQRSAVHTWLARLEPATRIGVEEVADLISGADPRLERAVKWERLTFAVGGNWHHWLCGTAVTKTTKLVFHKGALLKDPDGLLLGTGRYVRQLPLARAKENPAALVRLVRSAIGHETDLIDLD